MHGKRAMIVDLDSTDPEGWESDTNPHAGETVEEEVGGEIIETVVNNNVLQIKNDGLYLDSTWDCGEY